MENNQLNPIEILQKFYSRLPPESQKIISPDWSIVYRFTQPARLIEISRPRHHLLVRSIENIPPRAKIIFLYQDISCLKKHLYQQISGAELAQAGHFSWEGSPEYLDNFSHAFRRLQQISL